MSVLDTPIRKSPTADDGAIRIKRALAQTFQDIELTLEQIRSVAQRHGIAEVRTALGDDFAEVLQLYNSLKGLVEQHKEGAHIDEFDHAS